MHGGSATHPRVAALSFAPTDIGTTGAFASWTSSRTPTYIDLPPRKPLIPRTCLQFRLGQGLGAQICDRTRCVPTVVPMHTLSLYSPCTHRLSSVSINSTLSRGCSTCACGCWAASGEAWMQPCSLTSTHASS